MLPKYFKNLHLLISEITGTPRIVNIDLNKTNFSDKYVDIPKEEWKRAIVGSFSHFKEGERLLYIANNWEFFLGGNPKDKKHLIKILENAIKEVQSLKD